MSKQIFRSHNKVGETMSFKTNSPNTTTFDPAVGKISGRVSWDLGNGSGYTAGNSISYTYPNATTKTVTLRTNLLSTLKNLSAQDQNIVGHLDMSGWSNLGSGVSTSFDVGTNTQLTGITHTYTPHHMYLYSIQTCDITGYHDMTYFPAMAEYVYLYNNPNLSGVTFTSCTKNINRILINNCDLQGELDLSSLYNINLGGTLEFDANPSLTAVTYFTPWLTTGSTSYYSGGGTGLVGTHYTPRIYGTFVMYNCPNLQRLVHPPTNLSALDYYWIGNGGFVGEHDLSMIQNLGGNFQFQDNPGITAITHTTSYSAFTYYNAYYTGLIGNLDLTMLHALGGLFRTDNNQGNLTTITHTASTEVFTGYYASPNLAGNHNLSMFPNLGGNIVLQSNPNLTSITHCPSTQNISLYAMNNCDITGVHYLPFSGLSGGFYGHTNSNLTNIVHSATTGVFTSYKVHDCGLTGNFDMSMLTGLGGTFEFYNNPNLTSISFPFSTQTFANTGAATSQRACALHNCDLGYINFLPLSGATMNAGGTHGCTIGLENNGMAAADVNHILVDCKALSNIYNPTGWTGITLDISGTNLAPDTTSGGYNGIEAINSLTGTPNNWTITIT